MPTNLEKIEEAAREFFSKTGFSIDAIEINNTRDSAVFIGLKMDEPQILIGEGGQTLADIQRLLKIIINKKFGPELSFYVDLDINDYKKKKAEYLREMAKSTADEVVLTKAEKLLPVMSAYDRRVVHVELASRSDIITESIGDEPERRVIIKLR
ncbi:MAG: KH domain-containing protein [Candidatus Nealsonbacteria bacterium]|nr:KH domain-containing protein [Candidatus Nealsonbacteria bacterium]